MSNWYHLFANLSTFQEKLLENLHFHLTGNDDLDSCSVAHCLSHQKFALTVLERVRPSLVWGGCVHNGRHILQPVVWGGCVHNGLYVLQPVGRT